MSDKIQIVYFVDRRFHEIPEQDNPTFDTTKYSGKIARVNECLLLCKVAHPKTSGVLDGFTVIYIPLQGEIIRKGNFWNVESATVFIEALANYMGLIAELKEGK